MSDTRAEISEISALIQRTADLGARYTRETFGPQQVAPTHSTGVWRAGNDGPHTPDSHK
jgi:hypothetical protein